MPTFYVILIFLVSDAASTWTGYLQHQQSKYFEKSELYCSSLLSPRHGTVSCHHHGTRVSCRDKIHVGTIADYECESKFLPAPTPIIECLENGTWSSSSAPTCVPDCGKQTGFVTLIVNGAPATRGTYPWQVAIYNVLDNAHEFWCGGSLISEFSAITAAHCTWKVPTENLVVALGKIFRNFSKDEDNVQKIPVLRVELLSSYQDISGNYNGDLSVVFFEKAATFNDFIRPICVDWTQEHMDRQLYEGNLGTVLGWGLTENDTFSEVLRAIQMPVMSDKNCIAKQHKDFRKFITYTTFCAGFTNGSGVCNGDSGGGLSFLDEKTDTWYLQGVVSISPRRRGTSFCDLNFYTVFTKVTVFVKWLRQMKALEEELVTSGEIRLNDDDLNNLENEVTADMNPKADVLLDKVLETAHKKVSHGKGPVMRGL